MEKLYLPDRPEHRAETPQHGDGVEGGGHDDVLVAALDSVHSVLSPLTNVCVSAGEWRVWCSVRHDSADQTGADTAHHVVTLVTITLTSPH